MIKSAILVMNRQITSLKFTQILNMDFAKAREIIQTSLTLDSDKFVSFIQTFGPLLSFSYNLVLVL